MGKKMFWNPLESETNNKKEKYLQLIFNEWELRHDKYSIAGLPDWMNHNFVNNANEQAAYGYKFTPDVLWGEKKLIYVFELKRGIKYEPIALPEVLHHAAILKKLLYSDYSIKPILFTSYAPWLRIAIDYIRKNGFKSEALGYYEIDFLKFNNRNFIWIDNPLSEWEVYTEKKDCDKIFKIIPEHYKLTYKYFKFIEETKTIIGLQDDIEERPPIIEKPYFMLTKIRDNKDNNEFILWEGIPPKFKEKKCSKKAFGEYFVGSHCYSEGIIEDQMSPIISRK